MKPESTLVMSLPRACIALLLVSLVACGGGGGGGGAAAPAPVGGAPGNPVVVQVAQAMTSFVAVSDVEFEDAVTAVAAIVKQEHDAGVLASLTTQQIAANTLVAIQAASAGIPGYYDSGLSPGNDSVWVRLKDGTPIGQINNEAKWMVPVPTASLGAADHFASVRDFDAGRALAGIGRGLGDFLIPPALAATYSLPGSNKAFIADFDNLAPTASVELAAALTERGYRVTALSAPGLSLLRSSFVEGSSGYGVTWISSHAGEWVRADGTAGFGIFTGERVIPGGCAGTPGICADNRADIAAGRASALTDKSGFGYIAINEDFIRHYWKFPTESLVYLDVCTSTFFFSSLTASTAVGWSKPVGKGFAENAARWFFDRVTGGNKYQPNTPKQRPFSVPAVMASMASRGLTVEQNGGATLTAKQGANDLILAPSLRNMKVNESTQKLTLYGEFGVTSGQIEIDGVVKSPSPWTDKEIVVPISTTDKGPVVIKSSGVAGNTDIKGNAVPITDWRVSNHRSRHYLGVGLGLSSPALYMGVDCALHFRADIHPYRLTPEETPRTGDMVGSGPRRDNRVYVANVAQDSTCTREAGGTAVTTDGEIQYSLSATSTPVPWVPDDGTVYPTPWYFGTVTLFPETKQMTLCLNAAADNGNLSVTYLSIGQVYNVDWPLSSSAVCWASLDTKLWSLDSSYGIDVIGDRFGLGQHGSPGDIGEVNIQGVADPGSIPSADTEG